MAKSARPTTKSVRIDKEGLIKVNWSHVFEIKQGFMPDIISQCPKEIEEDMKVIYPLVEMFRERYVGQTVEIGLTEYVPGRPYEAYSVTIGDPVEGVDWTRG